MAGRKKTCTTEEVLAILAEDSGAAILPVDSESDDEDLLQPELHPDSSDSDYVLPPSESDEDYEPKMASAPPSHPQPSSPASTQLRPSTRTPPQPSSPASTQLRPSTRTLLSHHLLHLIPNHPKRRSTKEKEKRHINQPHPGSVAEAGLPEMGLPEAGLPEAGLPEAGLPEVGPPENDRGRPQVAHQRGERPKTRATQVHASQGPGPALDPITAWSPLSLFRMFFSSSVVQRLVDNTNANALKRSQAGKKHVWKVLTVRDFYVFLAIIIFSGLVHVHHRSDYWRKKWPYNFQFPSENMSRSRFEAILWSLHMSNLKKTRKTSAKGTPPSRGLSYSSVMDLLPLPLLGQGYTLFVDNFYTSPALFEDLSKKNIGCCGTIRKNKMEFPRTELNDLPKKAERGDLRWIRKGKILFVKWMDTREVSMCSTVHEAFSGQTVQRKVKQAGVWQTKTVPVPDAVLDYNRSMGGVDVSDALIGGEQLPSLQELYKIRNDPARTKPHTQKSFREKLAAEMLEFAGVPAAEASAAPSPPPLTCMPVYYGEDAPVEEVLQELL
ncbi:hypothetical protein F7725_017813 [Dissostichus mawsoni]|uniref:PiggyBac transposable element-derived protein domain-containing protein n=1 Tax=Dissostichus mawsoni TaxID=36200 RepID=A0A7J5XPN6_DISMA|nr:hypothetical protein F7725_017813 [Dissostichus mawsoni]